MYHVFLYEKDNGPIVNLTPYLALGHVIVVGELFKLSLFDSLES
jgi:hypothetical protein